MSECYFTVQQRAYFQNERTEQTLRNCMSFATLSVETSDSDIYGFYRIPGTLFLERHTAVDLF